MNVQTSDIKLMMSGAEVNAYIAMPPSGAGPGILLLHAWWGLKPFFKNLCNKLAEQGFVALAPDLRNGKIASTIDEAKALMQNSDNQLVGDIVMAAKDYLLSRTKGKIGVIGFSMGAAWALAASAADPDKISTCVLFYGVDSVDFGKVKSKFMGHFAEVDEWEPLEGVRALEEGMKNAGLDVDFYVYPNVGHWFMEDDRPEYNDAAAKLAWERTVKFLKKNS